MKVRRKITVQIEVEQEEGAYFTPDVVRSLRTLAEIHESMFLSWRGPKAGGIVHACAGRAEIRWETVPAEPVEEKAA